jgi:dihydrofolate reductase
VRKLIYFTVVSLDGYIDRPDSDLEWVKVDEELHTFFNELEHDISVYLYGRRMYELMQAYWPNAATQSDLVYEVEFSRIWKKIPKIVFSSALDEVEGNARLFKGDAVEEVTRLKHTSGGDLEVGGAILAAALMQAGLVDEYRIFIMPVLLGAGTPMIPALAAALPLKLIETRVFGSGVVYLRYER